MTNDCQGQGQGGAFAIETESTESATLTLTPYRGGVRSQGRIGYSAPGPGQGGVRVGQGQR